MVNRTEKKHRDRIVDLMER
jgi:hypothetical protein